MKLYEIPEAMRAWERRVEDRGGEIDDDLVADLDRLSAALEDRVDAVSALVREAHADAAACRAESAAFAAKARAREARARRLEEYVVTHLHALGLDRLKSRRFDVSIGRNSHPTISWPAGSDPPAGFGLVTTRLDGNAAQEAYRGGRLPEGFLVTHGEHLRIR